MGTLAKLLIVSWFQYNIEWGSSIDLFNDDDKKYALKITSFASFFLKWDITKTNLFKYTQFYQHKNDNFQIKILILLIFLLKT